MVISRPLRALLALTSVMIILPGCTSPWWSGGAGRVPAEPAIEHPEPERSPGTELMYNLMAAEIAGQRGDVQASLRHYLEALPLTSDPRIAQRATRIAVYADQSEAALTAARRWAELAPADPEAKQALAAIHLHRGEVDAAMPYLDELVAAADAASADDGRGFVAISALLSRESDPEAALDAMSQLADRHPDRPYAHYAHANLALHAGAPERALTAIDRALGLRAEWPEAQRLKSRIQVRLGQGDAAVETLGEAVEAHPDHTQLRLDYARLLVAEHRLEEAREEFERLSSESPDDPGLLYALGLLALDAERYDAAEKYLLRLVETGQQLGEAFYNLGEVARARGDYTAALEWYGKVPSGEYRLDAEVQMARVMAQRGDVKGARARFEELRGANPGAIVRLYQAEAETLREAGRYRAGLDVLSKALDEHPGNADLLYARSLIAERLDRVELAERDLRQIISNEPDNAHALNALGYTLADRTERYEEALEYIERALELEPNDPAIIDSLGWVHYRLGNYDEAVRHLRRALEVRFDPEIAAHLGEALWASGEKEQARDVWRRALERGKDDAAIVRRTMERLDE